MDKSVKPKTNIVVLKSVQTEQGKRLDWMKWLAVSILLLLGIVGNYYYSSVGTSLRLFVWFTMLGIAGVVASRTKAGKQFVGFFQDSRTELRRVVWPTREETMQMTMIIAVVVIILSLVLWALDGSLVALIGWLTGQRT
ncbi:MAG TPA: preprotein translocase subunit SecE [Gammaproteobacteria bacterium]|jgi:preprotein translocase subunit SecE|nr:preprotein translocase subunit SecE [Gammaproteobacteria bacterium]